MRFIYFLLPLFTAFMSAPRATQLNGAWKNVSGNETTIVLIEDGYITFTTFAIDSFKKTRGGILTAGETVLTIEPEFNTAAKELTPEKISFSLKDNTLTLDGKKFDRIDDASAPLSGVWKITGRMEDGNMNLIHQRGTRKTLKMLTGKRFQWFAIDPDGNQFFGTGGGTYTFENGKYTEHIDFFSRDNSRVGASLSFDGRLDSGKWHHSGLSSRGDKIYEIWEKAPSGK